MIHSAGGRMSYSRLSNSSRGSLASIGLVDVAAARWGIATAQSYQTLPTPRNNCTTAHLELWDATQFEKLRDVLFRVVPLLSLNLHLPWHRPWGLLMRHEHLWLRKLRKRRCSCTSDNSCGAGTLVEPLRCLERAGPRQR